MSKFFKELKKEKVSLVGIFVSIGLFIFSYFVPFDIPVPVSQDFLTNVGAGGGFATAPVIALSTVAIILFSVFLIITLVRVWRRK